MPGLKARSHSALRERRYAPRGQQLHACLFVAERAFSLSRIHYLNPAARDKAQRWLDSIRDD